MPVPHDRLGHAGVLKQLRGSHEEGCAGEQSQESTKICMKKSIAFLKMRARADSRTKEQRQFLIYEVCTNVVTFPLRVSFRTGSG